MTSPLDALEPRSVWKHFDEIRQIPHGSKNEAKIREHIKKWAAGHGFECREDAAGNLVIPVPATPGHEGAPTVVLQGHLDMVCEKNSDKVFDFDRDPLQVRVDGDWVRADGTTLGADNGLGVAAAMGAAVDKSVVHGPLELLFTVDEETGLTGAMELDAAMLTGRRMLNLDSEDDGVLFVGCAGGMNVRLRAPLDRANAPAGKGIKVHVHGARGGHSGLNIVENRANAIKVLTRILGRAFQDLEVALASIEGGNKHNAIPREATAVCVVPAGSVAPFRTLVETALAAALTEFGGVDPELAVTVEETDVPRRVLSSASRDRLALLLAALPHGVLAMSRDIPGLVETSNNLATVKTEEDAADLLLSCRSSVAAAIDATVQQIRAVGLLAGCLVEPSGGYPGWQPNMDSELLGVGKKVFAGIWGKEPHVTAIHAGLECGLIGHKIPGIDMLSFGPQLHGVHSPDEKAQISSTARFWEALKAMLRELA